ncbi:MAG: ferrous iron transport protein A [Actinomycetota bacterium]|nr:ferrous iron transport protein A [Actinomycetota bacterium]
MGDSAAGRQVRIYKVSDESVPTLGYLGEHKLDPGRLLNVKEVRTLDGAVTVEDEDGDSHAFGEALAASVFVRGETPA